MLIVLRQGCTPEQRKRIVRWIEEAGLTVRSGGPLDAGERMVLGVSGDELAVVDIPLDLLEGVEKVVPLRAPYQLAAREAQESDTVFDAGRARFGGGGLTIIAGPCAVEDEATLVEIARAARAAGAQVLRGGAFKPRTTPYHFQGLGEAGLRMLRDTARETGLSVVTEAMDTRHVGLVAEYADMIQVGSRNMQNYALLKAVAETGMAVLLKRGRACTVEEWLCAAEYLLAGGTRRVALCERGLVSFDPAVRHHLDLSCVPLVKRLSHLPVIVDPSHGTGHRDLVPAMARAAVAAGADGVMIEIHPCPERARSDARQAILPGELARLVPELHAIRDVLRKTAAAS
jgi:3-deoxy-7-phosphoheptulonate synthase